MLEFEIRSFEISTFKVGTTDQFIKDIFDASHSSRIAEHILRP